MLPPCLGLAYDIACSFSATLRQSSLGEKANASGLRMVVPAFHGHAHNRLCQLNNHILMSHGFGLEDLETCERVFSGSNSVAHLTRLATRYHRHMFIDMYFRQWDAEKYESLGKICLLFVSAMKGACTESLIRAVFTEQLQAGTGHVA